MYMVDSSSVKPQLLLLLLLFLHCHSRYSMSLHCEYHQSYRCIALITAPGHSTTGSAVAAAAKEGETEEGGGSQVGIGSRA